MKPSISVFFPCFNDDGTIAKLVSKAREVVEGRASRFEIIVVDDGSSDGSLVLLRRLAKRVKELKVIEHGRNLGYGAAIRSGLAAARYELVFYTDGDGQYDVCELGLLLDCLTEDVDVVNGIKIDRKDEGVRVFLGHIYRSLMRNLFNLPIYDVDCDFRLIRSEKVRKVKLRFSSGAVCLELVKKLEMAGARFREVSVHHFPRKYGKSEFFKLKRILATVRDVGRLWSELNFR